MALGDPLVHESGAGHRCAVDVMVVLFGPIGWRIRDWVPVGQVRQILECRGTVVGLNGNSYRRAFRQIDRFVRDKGPTIEMGVKRTPDVEFGAGAV